MSLEDEVIITIFQVKKVRTTTKDGEWHCKVCVTKPGGMEECTEESSVGYQISGNDNNDDTGTGEIKGIIIGERGHSAWRFSLQSGRQPALP